MRAILIADASFAVRERSMLRRLLVGFADEGVRGVLAIPESLGAPTAAVGAVEVGYASRGTRFSLAARARRLLESEHVSGARGDEPPNIVHAFGQESWRFAAETALAGGASLLVEVHRAGLGGALSNLRGFAASEVPIAGLVPDPHLGASLEREAGWLPRREAAWGVHAPSVLGERFVSGKTMNALVVGSGADAPAFQAAIGGLIDACRGVDELMIFVDARAARRADVWSQASRLGLRDRVTLVPDPEAHRELTLQADMLILPEAVGEPRSMVLEAMGSGVIVLAGADPMVGWLRDGETARLVVDPSPRAWALAVEWAIRSRDEAESLRASAWEHVRQHHKASAHVAAVIDAYEWLTQRDPIPFSTTSPGDAEPAPP